MDAGQIDPASVPAELRDFDGQVVDPSKLLYDAKAGGNDQAVLSIRAAMARQRSLPVHPTQLYSTATALLIALLCVSYFGLPHAPGRVFALMMMVEGPSRYLLELLRVEPPILGPMSLSMVLGIGIFVGGVALWVVLGRMGGDEARLPVESPRLSPA